MKSICSLCELNENNYITIWVDIIPFLIQSQYNRQVRIVARIRFCWWYGPFKSYSVNRTVLVKFDSSFISFYYFILQLIFFRFCKTQIARGVLTLIGCCLRFYLELV